ncbi:hypothetical protein [Nocardioides nanhaiensis]|uniref:DUF1918 domain-containing protein n=1 Tax=Nocardioides nanhaiensis TaxID=1476871 RepID=A0ABP8WZP3_9ACTN
MTENKAPSKASAKVGDVVDVKDGALVVRPDDTSFNVHGTQYVYDAPGKFVVDGDEVTVK